VGRAAKADPCVSAEFGVPAARAPELAGYEPVLGGAPPARIAAPAAHPLTTPAPSLPKKP